MPTARGESSDAELALLIQGSDHSAFRLLFTRYVTPLVEFATAHVGSIDTAEDLVADVFANVWRIRAGWQPQSVRAYLYSAVRNRVLNYLREHRRTVPMPADDVTNPSYDVSLPPSALDVLEADDRSNQLQAILHDMPIQRRAAAVLRWRDGLSNPEIAEALGISVKAVSMHLARAVKAVRDRMQLE